MSDFILNAVLRGSDKQGKGASRRLRKENLVPAIVYGGEGEPTAISLKKNELIKALESESFFASLIKLNLDGNEEEVIIKALQRHPAKGFPLHVDFHRVVRGQTMRFNTPVHFEGEAAGVKAGGVLSTNVTDVEIVCLPRQLPEYLSVDVSALQVGDALHLSDIKLPEGVAIADLISEGADRVIVSVQPPTVPQEDDSSATETTDGDA